MVSKTERLVLTSGWTSGGVLATAFSVVGAGALRRLRLTGTGAANISGDVRIVISTGSGEVVLDAITPTGYFSSGYVFPDVDLMTTIVQGSGTTLVSSAPTVTSFQSVMFNDNLLLQYQKMSGSVSIVAVVDVQKSLV